MSLPYSCCAKIYHRGSVLSVNIPMVIFHLVSSYALVIHSFEEINSSDPLQFPGQVEVFLDALNLWHGSN